MTRRGLAAALLALLLLWLVGYPLLVTLAQALEAPRWTLRHFVDFARRPEEWRALWASIWISLVTVGLAAAIGVPLAFLFERADFPGRRVLGSLVALPVVLPPLVGVIAFLFLYGESGFVARAIQSLFRLDAAPWRLAGPAAVLLVHAYTPRSRAAWVSSTATLPGCITCERLSSAAAMRPVAASRSWSVRFRRPCRLDAVPPSAPSILLAPAMVIRLLRGWSAWPQSPRG